MTDSWIRLLTGLSCGLLIIWSAELGEMSATFLAFSAGLLFATLIATQPDDDEETP